MPINATALSLEEEREKRLEANKFVDKIATATLLRAFSDVKDRRLERHIRAEARNWLQAAGSVWADMLGVSEENWIRLTSRVGLFYYTSANSRNYRPK